MPPDTNDAIGNVVVLTGAGISAESGLRTFRDAGGLWEGHRVEDVATPEAFARDPEQVCKFYNQRRAQLLDAKTAPNQAHLALARLEQQLGKSFTLITQNVDNLHQRAGNTHIYPMHGQLLQKRCTECAEVFATQEDMQLHESCAKCEKIGTMRPHIVWFGEMPLYMDIIYSLLEACRHFVAIGTSGSVYPAAGFVDIASSTAHATTWLLNAEAPSNAHQFDQVQLGSACDLVPKWVDDCLAGNLSA